MINGDFSLTLPIFPSPWPPLRGFPLEYCNGDGAQKTTREGDNNVHLFRHGTNIGSGRRDGCTVVVKSRALHAMLTHDKNALCDKVHFKNEQEFVRPRWPYVMRPSARAQKYICVSF